MKGLMNNDEAVRVFQNLRDSIINPIHQIYNIGYKQGYKDGYYVCIELLTEQTLAKMRDDERGDLHAMDDTGY